MKRLPSDHPFVVALKAGFKEVQPAKNRSEEQRELVARIPLGEKVVEP